MQFAIGLVGVGLIGVAALQIITLRRQALAMTNQEQLGETLRSIQEGVNGLQAKVDDLTEKLEAANDEMDNELADELALAKEIQSDLQGITAPLTEEQPIEDGTVSPSEPTESGEEPSA